jgi:hypothetical protein
MLLKQDANSTVFVKLDCSRKSSVISGPVFLSTVLQFQYQPKKHNYGRLMVLLLMDGTAGNIMPERYDICLANGGRAPHIFMYAVRLVKGGFQGLGIFPGTQWRIARCIFTGRWSIQSTFGSLVGCSDEVHHGFVGQPRQVLG